MNGGAKRAVRTIKESASSAIKFSGLGTEFWDFAVVDAGIKYNSIPPSSAHTSPNSLFLPHPPFPLRFLPFGTRGLVRISTATKTFQKKSFPARYLSFKRLRLSRSQHLHRHRSALPPVRFFSPTKHSLPPAVPPQSASPTHPTANLASTSSLPADPKTLRHAQHLPDAANWNAANDAFIDRNISLGAWKPVLESSIDKKILVRPRWQYKYKILADGTLVDTSVLDKRSARCTIRGDLMNAGILYYPS